MKTKATSIDHSLPLQVIELKDTGNEKTPLRIVHKSDFPNHQFAIHDNKTIENPINWDCTWFANYE